MLFTMPYRRKMKNVDLYDLLDLHEPTIKSSSLWSFSHCVGTIHQTWRPDCSPSNIEPLIQPFTTFAHCSTGRTVTKFSSNWSLMTTCRLYESRLKKSEDVQRLQELKTVIPQGQHAFYDLSWWTTNLVFRTRQESTSNSGKSLSQPKNWKQDGRSLKTLSETRPCLTISAKSGQRW